jgi:hypothetical protein
MGIEWLPDRCFADDGRHTALQCYSLIQSVTSEALLL